LLRRFNLITSRTDHRDLRYSLLLKLNPVYLPDSVNLEHLQSPVLDQGSMGSCSGNAAASMCEFLQLKELAIPKPLVYVRSKFTPVSRQFIYYHERLLEGTVDTDSGASLRDSCEVVTNIGVCRESLWPYLLSNLTLRPDQEAEVDARRHKISAFMQVVGLGELKSSLAPGFPVMLGFIVYPGMESSETAQTGILPMPGAGENPLGNHAVLIVGYDDKTKRIYIKNSWGSDWGLGGYFYMSYEYLSNVDLCPEMYTFRMASS
jgi:C1A family cysteine protease